MTYDNVRDAESRFVGKVRENILETYSSIFWPDLVKKEVRSSGGTLH